jgi:acetolactate synthase regulatory subunit
MPGALPMKVQFDPAALVAARFLVVAEASPGLLSRLLQPFAKRDLTPDAMRATREGETMRAEIALHAVEARLVHLIAGNLGQVIGVRGVQTLLSEAEEDRLAA